MVNKIWLRSGTRSIQTFCCCLLAFVMSSVFIGSTGCQPPVVAPGGGGDGSGGGDNGGGDNGGGNNGGGNNGGGSSGGDAVAIGLLASITHGSSGNLVGVDIVNDNVVNIDRTTGAATLISGNGAGTGPALDAPNRVALDTDGSILVTTIERMVYRVDPNSGNRTLLLDDSDDTDPFPHSFVGIAATTDGSILVTNVNNAPFIARVDEATGTLVEIATANLVGGAEEIKPTNGNAVIIVDSFRRAIVRVDATSGDETILSNFNTASGPVDSEVGTGPDFGQPRVLAIADDGTIYVADEGNSSFGLGVPVIFAIDPATGDRTVIAGPENGSGPEVARPQSMIIDDDGILVLIDAMHSGLLIVDPETGDRSLLALN